MINIDNNWLQFHVISTSYQKLWVVQSISLDLNNNSSRISSKNSEKGDFKDKSFWTSKKRPLAEITPLPFRESLMQNA